MPAAPPTILLASEHTDFDVGAERLAIALARRSAVPLHGIRVLVTNPEVEVAAPQWVARAEAAAAAAVDDLARVVTAAGVEARIRVRRGEDPWHAIVDEASDRKADLLVIRRRGKRAFVARLLLGDMVQKVASHASCDTLVVPRAAQLWQRCVLAAIDGSPIAARVITVAIAQAALAQLPLVVVRVCPSGDEHRAAGEAALADAVQRAKAAGVEATGRVLAGKIFSAVLEAGREAGADLFVVGRTGEHAVRYAALGGTTRKVVGLADCPVLVVKE